MCVVWCHPVVRMQAARIESETHSADKIIKYQFGSMTNDVQENRKLSMHVCFSRETRMTKQEGGMIRKLGSSFCCAYRRVRVKENI